MHTFMPCMLSHPPTIMFESLTLKGDYADEMYLIVEGRLLVYAADERSVEKVGTTHGFSFDYFILFTSNPGLAWCKKS